MSTAAADKTEGLTAGAAHELNNLLAVILGRAELLEGKGDLNAEDRLALRQILRAAERAAVLVRRAGD